VHFHTRKPKTPALGQKKCPTAQTRANRLKQFPPRGPPEAWALALSNGNPVNPLGWVSPTPHTSPEIGRQVVPSNSPPPPPASKNCLTFRQKTNVFQMAPPAPREPSLFPKHASRRGNEKGASFFVTSKSKKCCPAHSPRPPELLTRKKHSPRKTIPPRKVCWVCAPTAFDRKPTPLRP